MRAIGAIVVTFALLSGCSPQVVTLTWSKDFNRASVVAWESQMVRRWPDRKIVAVFCHGDSGDPWCLTPDSPRKRMPVENAADFLHAVMPGRLIVIVSCNESGAVLHTPQVAFARKRVWIDPGPDTRWSPQDCRPTTDIGNISEFEVTK